MKTKIQKAYKVLMNTTIDAGIGTKLELLDYCKNIINALIEQDDHELAYIHEQLEEYIELADRETEGD